MKANSEVVVIPSVIDVLKDDELMSFLNVAEERIELKKDKDRIEARIKELNDDLTNALASADVPKAVFAGYVFQIVSKTNSKLSKEKLIENGVSATVIAKSMIESQSSYLEVREQR